MAKRILYVFAAIFVGLQFFRPERNAAAAPSSDDLIHRLAPPPHVRAVLQTSCYDCHSNQTKYPWYAELQPTAWLLDQHVRDGKRQLNFSTFGKLPTKQAKAALESCADEVSENRMPLKSYCWIHHDARLSDEEAQAVAAWFDQAARRVASEQKGHGPNFASQE